MRIKHPADRDGRGTFERFSEHASNFTASRLFMGLCVLLVAAFIAVHAFGLSLAAQLAAGDAMTAVTLLLLALLKNSEKRAEYAIQRKLDALATALLEEKEGKDRDARAALEAAIEAEDEVEGRRKPAAHSCGRPGWLRVLRSAVADTGTGTVPG